MERIKVYVHSSRVSTLGFVDREGAQHACAQAGSSAFTGFQHYARASGMSGRYLTDKEEAPIAAVEDFCKTKDGVEFEIMDLARIGYLSKMLFWLKGLRSLPIVVFRENSTPGVPTEKALEKLLTT